MLSLVNHEHKRGKQLTFDNPRWKFFIIYLKGPGIAVCKFCEANGDFTDSEDWFESPFHLRQHLDDKRKGYRQALKKHEARGAGSKGGDSGGASSEKDTGIIIAYMDGVKPFMSTIVSFVIDTA